MVQCHDDPPKSEFTSTRDSDSRCVSARCCWPTRLIAIARTPRTRTNPGCDHIPGRRAAILMLRLSMARSSAAIKVGSTRPEMVPSSASVIGDSDSISPAVDGLSLICGPTRPSTIPATCKSSRAENAGRVAGPAVQRLSQRARSAALQVDAAVRHRRRLLEPVRRRDGQSGAGSPRQHRPGQRARGMSSRGSRLGDDARSVDGARGDDCAGDERLEVPLRQGQSPRGFAILASSGQAGRAALGLGF